jgi:DNA polymerase I-like protein with 3'-5' exonuclease and polymerase domains
VTVPGWLLDRERDFQKSFRPAALTGVRLDQDQVERLAEEHRDAREASRQRVQDATDGQITNPKSSPQVGPYLAATGRYELPLSEKTGKPSAAKGVLEPYAYLGDQLAKDILEYREHDTALGLLLEPRRELIEHGDGRVRTSILTLSANTGRTSSRNENLQQVSRQGGMRACHLAEPGCLIVSADFSSVEIRVGAALSGDSGMQEMIRLGDQYPDRKKEFDFHWRTAITVWGAEAVKENRYTAKRINFQKMYGGSPKGCAASVGIPLNLAQEVSRAFEALAPGYVAWDQWMRQSVRNGMKSFPTYSGREVWLTGKGEHAAGNAAIQGTAREFLVDAVLAWEQGPWGGHVIVPVHDEVVCFDVKEDEADRATAFLTECMTRSLNGVNIVAEANPPSRFWMDASLFSQGGGSWAETGASRQQACRTASAWRRVRGASRQRVPRATA